MDAAGGCLRPEKALCCHLPSHSLGGWDQQRMAVMEGEEGVKGGDMGHAQGHIAGWQLAMRTEIQVLKLPPSSGSTCLAGRRG